MRGRWDSSLISYLIDNDTQDSKKCLDTTVHPRDPKHLQPGNGPSTALQARPPSSTSRATGTTGSCPRPHSSGWHPPRRFWKLPRLFFATCPATRPSCSWAAARVTCTSTSDGKASTT